MRIQTVCFFLAIAPLYSAATSQLNAYRNVTNWARHREKRHLIFSNLGVQKFVVSIAIPVPLPDKRVWRSLSGAWNFQWQHLLPTTVLYWWNSTYYPAKSRSFGGPVLPTASVGETVDLTGTFLYAMTENYMDYKGVNGRECLMRSICENAQVNLVGGLLDRIYRRFLTPEKAMDQYYKDAFTVGERGANCHKTYSCPRGTSFFDRFVNIHVVD